MTRKKPFERSRSDKVDDLFADLLLARAIAEAGRQSLPSIDPFSDFDYKIEASLKQRCFLEFWKKHRLPGSPDTLVRAPLPRYYRATSKRRATFSKNRISLLFASERSRPGHLAESTLEPRSHAAVYKLAHAALSDPRNARAAKALSFLIVRGIARQVVIFNVHAVDGQIIRELRAIAEKIAAAFEQVGGCFVYVDRTRSPYYLEAKRPPRGELGYKKLLGSDRLRVEVAGRRISYPATVFSQVNEAMLPLLVEKVSKLVAPGPDSRLLDLFSGYGLFSHALFDRVGEIIGVDFEGPAIEAAKDNARRLGYIKKAMFISGRVSASLIEKRIPPPLGGPEIALLDPPRQGLEKGVAQALAARRPARVVHVFCGTDRLPVEIPQWRRSGYRVARTVPLDLFPGSANIETLVLLEPESR